MIIKWFIFYHDGVIGETKEKHKDEIYYFAI